MASARYFYQTARPIMAALLTAWPKDREDTHILMARFTREELRRIWHMVLASTKMKRKSTHMRENG